MCRTAGLLAGVILSLFAQVSSPTLLLAETPPSFLKGWGSCGSASGQFDNPLSLAVDLSGRVYVADTWNRRVQVFTNDGLHLDIWNLEDLAMAIATSRTGLIYRGWSTAVEAVTPDGTVQHGVSTTDSQGRSFGFITAIAVDPSETWIYVGFDVGGPPETNFAVVRFLSDGTSYETVAPYGWRDGEATQPWGLAVGPSGRLYVAAGGKIQIFSSDMHWLETWSLAGSPEWAWHRPAGIAVDELENIYVADLDRVLKLNSSGALLSTWGSQGTGPGEFSEARGIGVDPSGNVFVLDRLNCRVQKFGELPVVATPSTWGRIKAERR